MMQATNGTRVLTMREVRERLGFKGFGALYRLVNTDPPFVTFKTGDSPNSPRRMREAALERWIAKREVIERP